MGVNRMAGTPWHVEVLHKLKNDERRHRSRCTKYNSGYCTLYSSRCIGSAHCRYYEDINDTPSNNINKNQPHPNEKTMPQTNSARQKAINEENEKKSIGLNSKIELFDLSNKEHLTVTLVDGRGDLSKDSVYKISLDSKLAQKLIGCKVGSIVEVNGYRYRVIWYSRYGCL